MLHGDAYLVSSPSLGMSRGLGHEAGLGTSQKLGYFTVSPIEQCI